jgi:hypothetical protein
MEEIATKYGDPINKWPVQEVEKFSHIFHYQATFYEDIRTWDLSNAKNMDGLLHDARSFNLPLPWDTGSVTNMVSLFYDARSFNQPLPSCLFSSRLLQ